MEPRPAGGELARGEHGPGADPLLVALDLRPAILGAISLRINEPHLPWPPDAKLYWVPAHEAGAAEWGDTPPEAEGPFAELTYQRRPGQWIKVVAQNAPGRTMGLEKEDLTKIAEHITDEKQPVADVLRMKLPAGTEWGRVILNVATTQSWVTLVDAGRGRASSTSSCRKATSERR